MTALDLLEKAKRHNPAPPAKRNTDRWLPAVQILRAKGMTYLQIWEWLKAEGEPVHEDAPTFISAVSKRYRRSLGILPATGRKDSQPNNNTKQG